MQGTHDDGPYWLRTVDCQGNENPYRKNDGGIKTTIVNFLIMENWGTSLWLKQICSKSRQTPTEITNSFCFNSFPNLVFSKRSSLRVLVF